MSTLSASPALLAAQAKLFQLRKQLQSSPTQFASAEDAENETPPPLSLDSEGVSASGYTLSIRNGQKLLNAYRQRDSVAPTNKSPLDFTPLSLSNSLQAFARMSSSNEDESNQISVSQTVTVKHYPSIGVAALKEEQAANYRVWLMCRHLDSVGQGWLNIQLVRQRLTDKESELKLFGWRRLRQILGQGHGRFWKWDKQNGRLWLYSAARVAAHLNVTRLTGKPVALPVKAITAGMGEFKAHLYAAWHSGRKHNNPISRHTQTTITSIPERTQRHYCQVAGIKRQRNIAIGSRYNSEVAKEEAWQRGQAVFEFVDAKGKQGKKNGRYLAWHLPNSYISPHQQTAKGRMKKINRKLKDLVTKGTQGNEQLKIVKLYHANGADAARVINRNESSEAYWPVNHKTRKLTLWHVFCVQ